MQQKGAVRENVVLVGEAVVTMLSVFFFSQPLPVFILNQACLFHSFFSLFSLLVLSVGVKILFAPVHSRASGGALLVCRVIRPFCSFGWTNKDSCMPYQLYLAVLLAVLCIIYFYYYLVFKKKS